MNWGEIKSRLKATWEAGDFGEIAKYNLAAAEEFMARLPLRRGMTVLDVACGTGTLALIAARRGCVATGVDIARNLIAQARERAANEGLAIEFLEGDAEALPMPDRSVDAVLSRHGAMFAPRPEWVAAELYRVTKPGGFVAMANWTPEGLIGRMFEIFKAHLPPSGLPSAMLWGSEPIVRERLRAFASIMMTRRMARQRFPFSPAGTVDYFRRFYGPTIRAFEALTPEGREALYGDLVELQTRHNVTTLSEATETNAEYLEVIALR